MHDDIVRRHDQDHMPRVPLRDFVEQHLTFNGFMPPPTFDSTRGSVNAFISDNRWVVECVAANCNGALMVSVAEPYFLCVECGNRDNGGNWYLVNFPDTRNRIETLLLRRAHANRHWVDGETITQLEQENREHGLDDS
jgi:hypothetical protein